MFMNELINKDSEWIIHFMGSLDRLLDGFEHQIGRASCRERV